MLTGTSRRFRLATTYVTVQHGTLLEILEVKSRRKVMCVELAAVSCIIWKTVRSRDSTDQNQIEEVASGVVHPEN